MNVDRRNESIDAYFRALDEEDFSILEPHLSPEVTYKSVGVNTLFGPEGLREYFEGVRPFNDTDHVVENRIHDPSISVVEGHVIGSHLDTDFCDVFEFDDGRITRLTVYTND